ncbi:MAG: hypothetical protein U0103_16095 [Candidatus Obscuribacterales bacterium]
MHQIPKLSKKLLVAFTIMTVTSPASNAEANEFQLGMDNYRKHDWEEALSHLGAALPDEFNNANLHYHMANCMVHMRQKESAIREYRIAYALDPHGKIGSYSKQCLYLFGIDAAGFLPMPEAPPKLEKGKEVETLAKRDSKDSKDPKDSKDGKDSKDSGLAKVAKYVTEEDRVRQNLQDLMQSKPRPGSAHLQEIGTNVFVRNYKDPSHQQTIATDARNKSDNKPGSSTNNKSDNKSGSNAQSKSTEKSGAKQDAKPRSK